MSYYYRGKRYTKKPLKKLKTFASRAFKKMHGVHLDGGREPEHYQRQAEREIKEKTEEQAKDPDVKLMW